MKMISRVALALALMAATVGTTTLQADTFDRVAPRGVASGAEGDPAVRVMNNHGRWVRVYLITPNTQLHGFVVDSDHHRHLLGSVGPSKLKDLQIPSGLVRGIGTVQLKVYPVLTRPSLGYTSFKPAGIKTRWFSIQSDQVIEFHLERTLARSLAGIVSS